MDASHFTPATKAVSKGTRVVWKNTSTDDHRIKDVGSRWRFNRAIGIGDRVAHRFQNAGTYRYTCPIHPGMDGKIVVG